MCAVGVHDGITLGSHWEAVRAGQGFHPLLDGAIWLCTLFCLIVAFITSSLLGHLINNLLRT
jgi:hypothetical protein